MDAVLDLVERLPVAPLLAVAGAGAAGALVLAALLGGTVAVALLVAGALVVALAGGLLAVRVHLARMPLELAPVAVRMRIDGHPAFGFRARLGRGRSLEHARAVVRFVPESGEPVALSPLLPDGTSLVGPWSLVVVDRHERCTGSGRFEVQVKASERGRHWAASRAYASNDLHDGRFEPAQIVDGGGLRWRRDAWDQVSPPALTDAGPTPRG